MNSAIPKLNTHLVHDEEEMSDNELNLNESDDDSQENKGSKGELLTLF